MKKGQQRMDGKESICKAWQRYLPGDFKTSEKEAMTGNTFGEIGDSFEEYSFCIRQDTIFA